MVSLSSPDPAATTPARAAAIIGPETAWYKDAIIYELHVRAFSDSTGDGQGDFLGLSSKLDYLQDLGVSALWLLPFYPSPLRDDGYDISDYYNVHPNYGTLDDFREFLRSAHAHGLRVITELVLNHTSDQHPWFQRARRAQPGSVEQEYYVWSDSTDRFAGARVIFNDFETSNWAWDPLARRYYFHRFYFHQPDLNYDHPEVRRAMLGVMDYWLGMGVDGLRLDAVPYLYKREGTSCENLPETHAFLKQARAHIDERFADRMLLAEANQWPEDAAAYFGSGRGDECQTAFHFPLMPRMFMATRMESRFPIVDILDQTPAIPEDSQWVLFLRNHDELTLEMVSDEERDYMYRVYATDPRARVNLGIRRRLAPLLHNERRLIELMTALLLSLPGTPVLYYGDEIGMGDNIFLGDRNGVRSPMQWSPDRNAGFSRANTQSLYLPVIVDPEYHFEAINVETQLANPRSLLWYTKRIIALRKQHPVFGRGTIEFLRPENTHILAFLRKDAATNVLVVANLSRLSQAVELDLSAYPGARPVELFGQTSFPPVTPGPYRLTLGPYDCFWFRLDPATPPPAGGAATSTWQPLVFAESISPGLLTRRSFQTRLEAALPGYIAARRWFRGKGLVPVACHFWDQIPVGPGEKAPRFLVIQVEFAEGESQLYVLPVAFAWGANAAALRKSVPESILAIFGDSPGTEDGVLYDAAQDAGFVRPLLELLASGEIHRENGRELAAIRTEAFDLAQLETDLKKPIEALRSEQSNSSVRIGDRYIIKFYRSIGGGRNPELEMGLFLNGPGGFAQAPAVAGFVEWTPSFGDKETLAIVHRVVPNEGTAWEMTLTELGHYFERVRARVSAGPALPTDLVGAASAGHVEVPAAVADLIGSYLEPVRMLGTRTAEMHRALASDRVDPRFAPEPFTPLYLRSIYQTMQSSRRRTFDLLRRNLSRIAEPVRAEALGLLQNEPEIDRRLRTLLGSSLAAVRTRIHGDYHLGQVLWTGKDMVVIDFEGEPIRSVSDRKIRRSPLRDVAGMLRSFEYAAFAALRQSPSLPEETPEARRAVLGATRLWVDWVSSEFLRSYRARAAGGGFLPTETTDLNFLLEVYLLEKAIYELAYELNNRPDWVEIPILGLAHLLDMKGAT
ncbi:MAG TPA: maltose alpha-D-glucosyltransferase [Thermoplasmata archaeon]|nr:maltose alpha-D-glucosyltransferase [Thermoplasmata archaeon]